MLRSTLLRALTSSTPRIASYAFTTLNPHHGTCILWSDGTFSGPRPASPRDASTEISDTPSSPEYYSAATRHLSRAERRAQFEGGGGTTTTRGAERTEVMRFTMTDNPGLVADSSLNVGLGHAFLRHIERCSALVYVVDLSATSTQDPKEAIRSLRKELREYARAKGLEEGALVGRIKGVIANKADMFTPAPPPPAAPSSPESDEAVVEEQQHQLSPEEGRARLADLVSYVREIEREEIQAGFRNPDDDSIWVVPVSAKRRENVAALVKRLAETVKVERARAAEREAAEAVELEEEEEEEEEKNGAEI